MWKTFSLRSLFVVVTLSALVAAAVNWGGKQVILKCEVADGTILSIYTRGGFYEVSLPVYVSVAAHHGTSVSERIAYQVPCEERPSRSDLSILRNERAEVIFVTQDGIGGTSGRTDRVVVAYRHATGELYTRWTEEPSSLLEFFPEK